MSEIVQQYLKFKSWLSSQALPFWGTSGVDPNGGFWEALNHRGAPLSNLERRVRVQARMCYVYSHAAYLDLYDQARAASDHAWEFLTTNGLQGGQFGQLNSGCAHLLDAQGNIKDSMRDTYAQAFLILACAWRYRAFQDEYARSLLEGTVEFLETHLRAETGGWHEGIPNSLPRRQNPHMHLLEAFLASYEATSDEKYLMLADEVVALFMSKFWDSQLHCLREYFAENWSPAIRNGDLLEPGHMMEWCWLLNWHQRLSGNRHANLIEHLFSRASDLGRNPETGFLYNQVRFSGNVVDSESRLWPQTEYIKACLCRVAVVPEAKSAALSAIDNLVEGYLNGPVPGGWYDCRDAAGELTSDTMPASSFYHLFSLFAELCRVCDQSDLKH